MKPNTRRALLMMGFIVTSSLFAESPGLFVPPDRSTQRTVVLDCSQGWSGAALGQYGGVGFNLFCKNGRDRVKIEGVAATTYAIRMGAESSSVGLDCFFTGDAATVNETCGDAVRVTIR